MKGPDPNFPNYGEKKLIVAELEEFLRNLHACLLLARFNSEMTANDNASLPREEWARLARTLALAKEIVERYADE